MFTDQHDRGVLVAGFWFLDGGTDGPNPGLQKRAAKMALFHRIKSSLADNEAETTGSRSFELQSVGDTLRQQRLALGIDISEAAAALKIRPAYLAAIEEGCPDQLPGATYAVGFVRSYCQYLGLDSAELLRRFRSEAAGLQAKPDLTFPMPLSEGSLPAGRVLTIAVILAACGYGMWYYLTVPGRTLPERVAEVPADLLPAKPAISRPTRSTASAASARVPQPRGPAGAASEADASGARLATTAPGNGPSARNARGADLSNSEPTATGAPVLPVGASPSVSAPSIATPPATVAARPDFAPSSAFPPAMAAAPALVPAAANPPALAPPNPSPGAIAQRPTSPAPSPPPGLATTGAFATARDGTQIPAGLAAASPPQPEDRSGSVSGAVDASRIMLRANADSWIQIRGANHSVVFTGVLKAGDTYRVPDRPGLTMRAGNAGGLEIMVDGKAAPALGPMGAVRNVSLDPQTLAGQGVAHN